MINYHNNKKIIIKINNNNNKIVLLQMMINKYHKIWIQNHYKMEREQKKQKT